MLYVINSIYKTFSLDCYQHFKELSQTEKVCECVYVVQIGKCQLLNDSLSSYGSFILTRKFLIKEMKRLAHT